LPFTFFCFLLLGANRFKAFCTVFPSLFFLIFFVNFLSFLPNFFLALFKYFFAYFLNFLFVFALRTFDKNFLNFLLFKSFPTLDFNFLPSFERKNLFAAPLAFSNKFPFLADFLNFFNNLFTGLLLPLDFKNFPNAFFGFNFFPRLSTTCFVNGLFFNLSSITSLAISLRSFSLLSGSLIFCAISTPLSTSFATWSGLFKP